VTDDDPDEYGDLYSLTAMESDTKLFISHHEGGRSTDDATELFTDFESKRSNTSPIPLFTSDDWDPFELGLLTAIRKIDSPTPQQKREASILMHPLPAVGSWHLMLIYLYQVDPIT
jgi:hypothetical protein